MGLSRLDNFLKSVRGTILYVDPSSIDATDNIENQGNSLTRPFRTVQRALIEASRFSYQRGFNNDRFNKTTILLYPGDHTIDNRPGWIPDGASNFRLRSGETSADLTAFDLDTNFDLTAANNALYKFNSIHGGVIIPRGTSIVGMDLRKTRIRPSYVPNPANDELNINLSQNASSISIKGMDGKVISIHSLIGNSASLNISNLVSGVYICEVVAENGNLSHTTFIKK